MKPTVLVVNDGMGLRDEKKGNAFRQADTPNLDSMMEDDFPRLKAWGEAVGLPEGYQGNSEVGHLHLGAGKRVPQRLSRINQAIEKRELGEKEALEAALSRAEENGSEVHLAGIISDGGIHGHIDHLDALMRITQDYDLEKVWIHCFTDGRDVAPKSAEKFIEKIRGWMEEYDSSFGFATVMGRYFAMDRDHNWDRTHKAYQAMAQAEGFEFSGPEEAVEKTYDAGDYDYFVQPSVNECYEGMNSDDELVFYNYRADREIQIEEEMVAEKDPDEYSEPVHPNFTSMFPYEKELEVPSMFEKMTVENTLGEKLESEEISQLRVTESQKIPHMTYFFNGQREIQFENETRRFVESDKIRAYDQKPEMHAGDITDILVEAIEEGDHEFIIANFPNGDLVGHTGKMDAAIRAVETVDHCIGRIKKAVESTDYALLVTADHGNCEDMGTEENPNTSHTLNPVPLLKFNTDRDLNKIIEQGELWEVEKVVEEFLEI